MLLREDILTPIAGESPGGPSLRYDPVYDRIKEARREDLDIPQGDWQTTRKTADWPLVVKLASETIATRSKDLQLAAWLAEALLKRDGLPGLAGGLDLIRGLLETFWDELHPELEEDDLELRAAPIEWVGRYLDAPVKLIPITTSGLTIFNYREALSIGYERDAANDYELRDAFKAAVAQGKITADEFDKAFAATGKEWYRSLIQAIDACAESIDELDVVSRDRFGPDAPSFHGLRGALEEVRPTVVELFERKLKSDPDPVAEEPEAVGDAGPGAGTGGADGSAQSGDSAVAPAGLGGLTIAPLPRSQDEAGNRIGAAAKFLRTSMPGNPAPFLMLRGFRWGELRAGGGDFEPQLLVAAPTEVRSRLKQSMLEERWPELLEACEDVMATPYGRGWLDLQRYTVAACEGLGEDYAAVAAAVRSAIRGLLQDLPWLPEVTLMDDTPTANAETLSWLRAEELLGGGRGAERAEEGHAPRVRLAVRRDVADEAADLLARRKPEGAIEALMTAAARENGERARFLRRLEAARIMVDQGFASVALPLLEEMELQIAEHKLDAWESRGLVAQPLALLYRCRKQIDAYASVDELFVRVSRLDPVLAMQLGGPDGNAGE